LERHESSYRLNTRGWAVDLDDAEQLVRLAEHHLALDEPGFAYPVAKRATQLLETGRPLEDQRSLSAADDLGATTDALARRAQRACWTSALATDDAEGAHVAASAAASADPLDEEAQRAVMRAQYERGEHNAALRTYHHLQRVLRRELGTDPDPETQQLHVRVLRGQPTSPAGPPSTTRDHAGRTVHVPRQRPELHLAGRGVPMVGRGEVLARLDDVWRVATLGEPGMVVMSGAPGVGKSELLRRMTDQVKEAGGAALMARCTVTDGAAPLHSLTEAIRRFCAAEHPDLVRDAARGAEASLAELIPPLSPVLGAPDLGPCASHHPRLLNAVQSFVTNLSGSRPVLLAVDDVHLADHDTITVLRQLCAANSGRVMVMVTESEGENTLLIDALSTSARRLRLRPLTVDDVSELAAIWRVPQAVSEVYSLTGGLPGLVVEALRAVSGGAAVEELDHILPSLDDTILDHLRRAGDAVVSLLSLAAAVGRRFHFDDLLRMGVPIAEAAAGVQRAMHLGLLEADGDTLVFAGRLVHLAVLNTVPEPVRRELVKGAGLPADEHPGRRSSSAQGHMPVPSGIDDLKPAS
jgi:hypothetical protein